jgi:hypothetical protein
MYVARHARTGLRSADVPSSERMSGQASIFDEPVPRETRVPKKTVNCVASTQFNGFADPSRRRRRRRRSSLIITRTTGMEVLEVGGIAGCPKCVSLRREIETVCC